MEKKRKEKSLNCELRLVNDSCPFAHEENESEINNSNIFTQCLISDDSSVGRSWLEDRLPVVSSPRRHNREYRNASGRFGSIGTAARSTIERGLSARLTRRVYYLRRAEVPITRRRTVTATAVAPGRVSGREEGPPRGRVRRDFFFRGLGTRDVDTRHGGVADSRTRLASEGGRRVYLHRGHTVNGGEGR